MEKDCKKGWDTNVVFACLAVFLKQELRVHLNYGLADQKDVSAPGNCADSDCLSHGSYEYFWILVGVLVACTILLYMAAGLIPGPLTL